MTIPCGTFKATKKGLVEIPQRWIRWNGMFITPKNPMYSVISTYGNVQEFTQEEVLNYLAYMSDEVRFES